MGHYMSNTPCNTVGMIVIGTILTLIGWSALGLGVCVAILFGIAFTKINRKDRRGRRFSDSGLPLSDLLHRF